MSPLRNPVVQEDQNATVFSEEDFPPLPMSQTRKQTQNVAAPVSEQEQEEPATSDIQESSPIR